MLTRRQALVGAAAAGVTALVRGGTDAFAVPLPSTPLNFDVPKGYDRLSPARRWT